MCLLSSAPPSYAEPYAELYCSGTDLDDVTFPGDAVVWCQVPRPALAPPPSTRPRKSTES